MYHLSPGAEGSSARIKRRNDPLEFRASPDTKAMQLARWPHLGSKTPIQPFAILCLDLDQFRWAQGISQAHDQDNSVNYQNRLFKNLTQELHARLREGDMVSQVSDTQFVIALRSSSLKQVPQVASRLADFFNTPIRFGDHQYQVNCSIGISFYPGDGLDTHELIRKAHVAVDQATNASNTFNIKLCPSDTSQAIHRRLLIEQALQDPELPQQLKLLYQPQWDHHRDRLYGFEGLVRWHHPVLGDISPNEFIPIAEELGCIHRITHLAIAESLHLTQEIWEEYGVLLNSSVNISAQEFAEFHQLYDTINRELNRSQLPDNVLTVELTERVFLTPSKQIALQMKQLRNRGVKITLDDFGTGFSCLQYLLDLPLNMLKIDRAFVQNIDQDTRRYGIVQAIISMAKSLEMNCIAEGIETTSELDCLHKFGCHLTQGHLIAPALTQSSFIEFFTQSFPPQ